MKVLVRKSPFVKKDQEEVYPEPWLDWVDPETGAPLTDENYGYALCEIPDGAVAPTEDDPSGIPGIDRFTVTEEWVEEPDPYDPEAVVRRRILRARFNP